MSTFRCLVRSIDPGKNLPKHRTGVPGWEGHWAMRWGYCPQSPEGSAPSIPRPRRGCRRQHWHQRQHCCRRASSPSAFQNTLCLSGFLLLIGGSLGGGEGRREEQRGPEDGGCPVEHHCSILCMRAYMVLPKSQIKSLPRRYDLAQTSLSISIGERSGTRCATFGTTRVVG